MFVAAIELPVMDWLASISIPPMGEIELFAIALKPMVFPLMLFMVTVALTAPTHRYRSPRSGPRPRHCPR